MANKVLIPQAVAAAGTNYLLQHGYDVVQLKGFGREDILAALPGCSAILLRTALITREILEAADQLKIVARHGAGFDNVDLQAAAEQGIWVTNAPMSTTVSVAETAITLLLMLAKRIPLFSQGLSNGNFNIRNAHMGAEIEGKTLAIIGLGRIGSEVARKALEGFGMRVVAYDPFCTPSHVPEHVALLPTVEEALACADFVSLHMPNVPETYKMFGEREFRQMKPTAYLINCARGEVVDETALCKAMEAGLIAGAALDVYCPEPPQVDNPLLHMPQVIATPHIASNTVESMDKMALHAAMEIHRTLSGNKPMWPVNTPIFTASSTL